MRTFKNISRLSFARLTSLSLVLALGSSSCMLTDMHEATMKMSDTTESMNEQVRRTREAAEATYRDLRQGNSMTIRSQRFETMQKAESMEKKISEAGLYYMAYEFQLWKDNSADTAYIRDWLYHDAAIQIFRDLSEFSLIKKGKIDPTSKENSDRNLFALAVAIHVINPNAEQLAHAKSVNHVSLLSLIKEALRKSAAVETGEIKWSSGLKEYEREILKNAPEAIRLMQIRANMLLCMVLAKLTDAEDANLIKKAWMAYVGTKARISKLSLAQMEAYTPWIREANSTIAFLNEIGAPLELNSDVQMFYRNLELPKLEASAKGSKSSERQQVERGLIEEIEKFRSEVRSRS